VPRDPYQAAVQRGVQSLVVARLMDLAADDSASPQVRAGATEALRWLLLSDTATGINAATLEPTQAHLHSTHEEIERFLARPDAPRKRTPPPSTPPGDPIGSGPQ
jgi:hypothetical protein